MNSRAPHTLGVAPTEPEWPEVLVCAGCGCEVRPRGLSIMASGARMMANEDMYEAFVGQPGAGWLCAYCYLVAEFMAEPVGSELAAVCRRRLKLLYGAGWHRDWPPAPMLAERARVLGVALGHGVHPNRALAAAEVGLPRGYARLLKYAALWGWLAR